MSSLMTEKINPDPLESSLGNINRTYPDIQKNPSAARIPDGKILQVRLSLSLSVRYTCVIVSLCFLLLFFQIFRPVRIIRCYYIMDIMPIKGETQIGENSFLP